MEIIVVVTLSYFFGSIPFGFILAKAFIKKDLRNFGSGNIGTTNVLRTGKKSLALITLILDASKGYIPVIISQVYFSELVLIAALTSFLGHVFPIWLNFKGGKGVATFLGILFALSLSLAILFIFTWIVVALIFKYSSVSSIFASLTIFIVSAFKEISIKILKPNLVLDENITFLLFVFLILVIFTHKKNISNLKNKTESKIKI